MRSCAFDGYHPLVTFSFFIGAIVLDVIVSHPAFQAVSLLAAATLYLTVRGIAGFKTIGGLCIAFVVIALVNAFFTDMGDTVLFTCFDRSCTLEGLMYGASTSAMFVSMMLWFASYARLMTSDRFAYLFGGLAPAVTLVLTMALRLVPSCQRRASQISTARKGVGKSAFDGSARHRVEDGAAVLSALATWALEGSIVTADSMRSRGYGVGERSSYARYAFCARDAAALAWFVALFAIGCALVALGAAAIAYLPSIVAHPFDFASWCALVAFALFMFAPTFLNARESIAWNCSLSKI